MLGITNHAVEQFCSRWRPEAEPSEAEVELRALVDGARPLRKRTLSGDAQLYVNTSGTGERITFVVRDNHVITVLGQDAGSHVPVDHSVDLAMFEEHLADLEAARQAVASDPLPPPDPPPPPLRTIAERQRYEAAHRLITEVRTGKRTVKPATLVRAHETVGIALGARLPKSPQPEKFGADPETSRKLNAQVVLDNWKNGIGYSNKALQRAHDVLGLPFTPRVAPPPDPVLQAKNIVESWHAGINYSRQVLQEAHRTLGLPFNPQAR